MNKTFLILLLAKAGYSEARFIPLLQAEVSKRFYSSKAMYKGSCNVRDFLPVIGTVHIRILICVHACVKFERSMPTAAMMTDTATRLRP
jgi:hypothetical protein